MIRAAVILAGLLIATGASVAGDIVPNLIDLHFVAANGVAHDVQERWAVPLPELASGAPDCRGDLGGMLPALEKEARRKLQGGAQMELKGVTCEPLGKEWVKVVQRVPVTGAAANKE